MTNRIHCLNDFKIQVNKLYDMFKLLTTEEQTEAIQLIKELQITSLNYFLQNGITLQDNNCLKNQHVKFECKVAQDHPISNKTVPSMSMDKKKISVSVWSPKSEYNGIKKSDTLRTDNNENKITKDSTLKINYSGNVDISCNDDYLLKNEQLAELSLKQTQPLTESNKLADKSTIAINDISTGALDKDCSLNLNRIQSKHDGNEFLSKQNTDIKNAKQEKQSATMLAKPNKLKKKILLKQKGFSKYGIKPIKLKPVKPILEKTETNALNCEVNNSFGTLMSCRFCKKEFKSLAEHKDHLCEKIDSSKPNTYNCELCNTSYTHKHHLNRHMLGHKRNNCKVCSAQFAKRKLLCKHLKNVHNILEPEKLYQCHFCDKSFHKSLSLNSHLKQHANGRFLCLKCGFMSENETLYSDHMEEHLRQSKFECSLCDKKFIRRLQYDQHMLGHERHSCSSCDDVTFSTKKLLLKHQYSVHGTKIVKKKHKCPSCQKLFLRPKHLQIHLRTHTGEEPVQCSHCNKSFCNERALAKHIKTVRHIQQVNIEKGEVIEIEKKFLCSECGAKFYQQQSLLRHIELIHVDGEPLKCSVCDYSTKCKTNLKRHEKLHTSDKRYVCEICGSSFHALATLNDHHSYVHSDKRSFICEICSKGFKCKNSLQRHAKVHSVARPYKCHCNRDYKRLSHLKRHMATAHCMLLKGKKIQKIGQSSDTNISNTLEKVLETLQDHSSSEDFTALSNNYNAAEINPPGDDCNNSSKDEQYATVPSNIETYLGTNQVCLQTDVHSSNSVSLDDPNLNLSPTNYCTFNLSSSPLDSLTIDTVSSNFNQILNPNSSHLSSVQDNLARPHSLPNLNFPVPSSSIDSFTPFSLHNGDSPISSLTIPNFLLNVDQTPDMSQINSPKQLFGDSSELLSLPSYASNNNLSVNLFSESRNDNIWGTAVDNRIKIADNDMAGTACSNSITASISNFSGPLTSTSNGMLSHNLIFPTDSLMTMDTSSLNSEEFESLSSLC